MGRRQRRGHLSRGDAPVRQIYTQKVTPVEADMIVINSRLATSHRPKVGHKRVHETMHDAIVQTMREACPCDVLRVTAAEPTTHRESIDSFRRNAGAGCLPDFCRATSTCHGWCIPLFTSPLFRLCDTAVPNLLPAHFRGLETSLQTTVHSQPTTTSATDQLLAPPAFPRSCLSLSLRARSHTFLRSHVPLPGTKRRTRQKLQGR